ncbi:hypothetical protein IC229_15675 [Spirosoma sp. BT702]|uniref:LPS export ABC transporter periplasmic protein LptC n=1 Tax=Spirosoma profusum TaxID=2771354 RepID=A0A927ASZ6_9BACT|nr:hypothetical protein [Spirosoma profusum]MBD2702090.1 hypothetical protein [Spirosoma profusum]
MRLIPILFSIVPLLLSNCTNPAQQNQAPVYYDVVGFVQKQIAGLSAQKPLVSKTVSINEKRNQQNTHDINWAKELELFVQADINKPALRSSYVITRPDSATYQYTLKPEEHLAVQSLTVQLDATSHQPRRIEAVMQTSNPLYTSERHVLLESGPAAGREWQVKHYKLTGYQKLPYFNKNEFLVEGQVQ